MRREIVVALIFLLVFGVNRFMNRRAPEIQPKPAITRTTTAPAVERPVQPKTVFSYNKSYMDLQDGNYARLLRECETATDPRAKSLLGECYWNGYGVVKDREKAVQYFNQAFNNGYADAYAVLGNLQLKEGNHKEGFLNCQNAADGGGAFGYLLCAFGYNTGAWGASKDVAKTVDCYSRAFDAYYNRGMENDVEACFMMAEIYRNGWGVQADAQRENYWQKRAEEIVHTGTYKEKS